MLAIAPVAALAQQLSAPPVPSAPAASNRIEGDWVRVDKNGSVVFDGLANSFDVALLTPEAAAAMAKARTAGRGLRPLDGTPHEAGKPYIVVDKPCLPGPFADGALGVNPDSGAIHIVEARNEVVIAPERAGVRVIYMDGRAHPDPTRLTPRGSGHGVGHYENGVLVVDTVGQPSGFVPPNGWRTPETHLTERFEVSADGQHMSIHYTYTDPKVYQKPHSYSYDFDRLPSPSYALDEWCDGSDPKESQSIVPPPQK
jgi:hypothetical protein